MEKKIVTDLNPAYEEIYLGALRDNGLNAYVKQLNIDAWIRSIDIFLVYEDDDELQLARQVLRDLEQPVETGCPPELSGDLDREEAISPVPVPESAVVLAAPDPSRLATALADAMDRHLGALIERQKEKVLRLARTRTLDLTGDDLPAARERLDLLNWPDFQYESGLLAGLLGAQAALREQHKE